MTDTPPRRSDRRRRDLLKGSLTMMIALGLKLGPAPATAGDGPPPARPPQPKPEVALAVAAFSRDMTVFDSDFARGGNAADIPLSGTTDADDGLTIEARIVRADTGAEVHPWMDVGVVSKGSWGGSYFAAQRNTAWLKPQVRVKGATRTATTSNRFGVGLVVALENQSQVHRALLPGMPGDSALREEITIGNQPGQFQIRAIHATHNSGNNPAAFDIAFVHDGQKITAPLAWMAKTFHEKMGNVPVMFFFHTLSGSGPFDPLNYDDGGDRDPDSVRAMADELHADGAKVGMFWGRNEKLRDYFLEDESGNPIAPEDTGQDLSWAEVYPELPDGYTRMFNLGRISVDPYTTADGGSDIKAGAFDWQFAIDHPDKGVYGGHYNRIGRWDAYRDTVHFPSDRWSGMPRQFASFAKAIMRAGGILPNIHPVFDNAEYEANGRYIRLKSSYGPATTQERLLRGSEAVNFPLDPGVDSTPGESEVYGFTDSYGHNLVAKIVAPDTETPATQGDILVYPYGPDVGNTSSRFDGVSTPYYLRNGVGVLATEAAIAGNKREIYFKDYDITAHMPICDDGFLVDPGQQIAPPGPDRENWLALQNDLEAVSTNGIYVDGSDHPDWAVPIEPNGTRTEMTFEGVVHLSGTMEGAAALYGESSEAYSAVQITGSRALEVWISQGGRYDPLVGMRFTEVVLPYSEDTRFMVQGNMDSGGYQFTAVIFAPDGSIASQQTLQGSDLTSWNMRGGSFFPPHRRFRANYFVGHTENPSFRGWVEYLRLWDTESGTIGDRPTADPVASLVKNNGALVLT